METDLLYIIKSLIMPPGFIIFLAISGLLMINRYRKTGSGLILISILTLYFLSTTYVSRQLAGLLETTPSIPVTIPAATDRQAIVILGGARYVEMPEYGKPIPHAYVLERLRYAVYIQKQTHLPILVTGGRVFPGSESEAHIMNQVLIDSFQTGARWLEEESRNTAQNAENSYKLLEQEGIKRIYLVTHSIHMKRATTIFTSKGFDVTPAPTIYYSAGTNLPPLMQWLPRSNALQLSHDTLYEMLGQWWYSLRHN